MICIGDKSIFAIGYRFLDDECTTELAVYVGGKNILEFVRDGKVMTTTWDLEELALWLRNFLNTLCDDPYPVETEGRYAAEKDVTARTFECDDLDEFDAWYDRLDEWTFRHCWHSASAGAVLADVYFQQVGNTVEISWNNRDFQDNVSFTNEFGGAAVPKKLFVAVVDEFLKEYANHWYT